MLGGRWNGAALGRVNPYVPLTVVAAGAVLFVSVSRPIGVGVVVGAVLALMNMLFLSGRVDVATATGDMGQALMVMQLGMLTTLALVAVVTIALIHFSLAMAVAAAAGFGVTQMAMLAVFYWTRGRADVTAGRQTQ